MEKYSERNWPQLMCCALVVPNVLISEGQLRSGIQRKDRKRKLGVNEIDFKTGVHNTET
jgi:hypothetical protein